MSISHLLLFAVHSKIIHVCKLQHSMPFKILNTSGIISFNIHHDKIIKYSSHSKHMLKYAQKAKTEKYHNDDHKSKAMEKFTAF